MNSEEVIQKHPSLCYTCEHCRKTWSDKLEQSGHTACSWPLLMEAEYRSTVESREFLHIKDARLIGTGWTDMKGKPFTKGSGRMINEQLIVQGVTKCSQYTPKE